jgi:hypothetical protein
LPWDTGANKKGNKPKTLSDMEQFLYDINVDIKASNGYNDSFDDESDEEWNENWTPPEGMRKKKRRKRFRGGARQRSEILSSCSIVLATLSGAGSKAFIDAVCRCENKTNSEFRAVIIDESCQSSESESFQVQSNNCYFSWGSAATACFDIIIFRSQHLRKVPV